MKRELKPERAVTVRLQRLDQIMLHEVDGGMEWKRKARSFFAPSCA